MHLVRNMSHRWDSDCETLTMSATLLHAAGFTDLVSVIPPGAKLSPRSKIKPEQLGKVPGKLTGGAWSGYKFTKETVKPEDIDKWGANVNSMETLCV